MIFSTRNSKKSTLVLSDPKLYVDLTPRDDVENSTYSESLKWALENDNIKNIAVTGPYGSGKSSVLRSFEKKNNQWKYLKISLGTFKNSEEKYANKINEGKDINNPLKSIKDLVPEEQNRLIELSILQQIFYSEEHKKLENSRFNKIKTYKKSDFILNSILFVVWIILSYLLLNLRLIQNSIVSESFTPSKNSVWLYIDIFIWIGLTFYLLITVQKAFSKLKLNKLNIFNGEIELNKDSDPSILNKYLDEILYFFEVTPYNVVVFEDLDRFNNDEIFLKLREINTLINNYSKKLKGKVVFIYAIKDDLFIERNRTKFFDFIIPIIPVINTSNAKELFSKELKKSDSDIKISDDFINEVSLYLDDMRIVYNIRNEFVIYKKLLKVLSLNQDKLVAIIIYKNIYPCDFAKLHNNDGMVFKAFNKKNELITALVKEQKQKIIEIKDRIEQEELIRLKDVLELRSIYVLKLLEKIPGATAIRIENRNCSLIEIKSDNLFNKLKTFDDILYFLPTQGGNVRSGISFKQLEQEVDPLEGYDEREKIILQKINRKVIYTQLELSKMEMEVTEIGFWSLKEIIKNIGLDSSLDEDIKNESLLVYLVRNGYIDENYHNYISYFYEGSLTQNDKKFALSITDEQPLSFDFKLSQYDNLIKTINPKKFESKSVYNYDLINHLLNKSNIYKTQIDYLFTQLADESEKTIEIIIAYAIHGTEIANFIKLLCKKWSGIWFYIEMNPNFFIDIKDKFLGLILKYSELDDISRINERSTLSDYIEKKEDFLSVFPDKKDLKKVKDIISLLDIHFNNLDVPNDTNEIFDFIYENNYYQINELMIETIINIKSKNKPSIQDLKHSNLTTILQSNCIKLIEYIDKNIDQYLAEVFLNLVENNNESEETIIKLLNLEKLNPELKGKIIKKEEVRIFSINNITDKTVWNILFSNNKIEASWDNILAYYEYSGEIDQHLIEFINNLDNAETLSVPSIEDSKENFTEELCADLADKIMDCVKISDNSFDFLLDSISYEYYEPSFTNLNKNKATSIILKDKFQFNPKTYEFFKRNFSPLHIQFQIKNIVTYLNDEHPFDIDSSDYQALLSSNKINLEQKKLLIMDIKSNMISSNPLLAQIILNTLLPTDNFVEKDKLLAIIEQIEQSSNLIKFITRHIDLLTVDEITFIFNELGKPYSLLTPLFKKPKLDYTVTNENLLQELKKVEYISSYKPDKGKFKIVNRYR